MVVSTTVVYQNCPHASEISISCGTRIFASHQIRPSRAVVSATLVYCKNASAIEILMNCGTLISVSRQIRPSDAAVSATLIHQRCAGAGEILDISGERRYSLMRRVRKYSSSPRVRLRSLSEDRAFNKLISERGGQAAGVESTKLGEKKQSRISCLLSKSKAHTPRLVVFEDQDHYFALPPATNTCPTPHAGDAHRAVRISDLTNAGLILDDCHQDTSMRSQQTPPARGRYN
jgi:hypothetical protein